MSVVMHKGAVVMLDILGFRGIWRREKAEAVIGRLEELADEVRSQAAEIERGSRTSDDSFITVCQPAFLSDTIVLGLKPNVPARLNRTEIAVTLGITFDEASISGEAVAAGARMAADLQRAALRGRPAFALRGCIAFGDFGITDRFIIGESVDEAAEGMNSAHGALVWLAPSADRFEQPRKPWSHYPLLRYDVPVKARSNREKSTRSSLCVVPFADDFGHEAMSALYATTFVPADPVNQSLATDVDEKKANTLAFLRRADAAWRWHVDPALEALNPGGEGLP